MGITFESYELRKDRVLSFLEGHGIASMEEAEEICGEAGLDVRQMVRDIQPICFEDAAWAYTVGAAAAIRQNDAAAAAIANTLGGGLQSFCLPGSVAEHRKVGIGHGKLAKMLLSDHVRSFCFLAGHESFAAAEGAIGIARSANQVRREPLKVILNGLGKDAAEIVARVNGFTYVRTRFDFAAERLELVGERAYSTGDRAAVRCYGANEMREGLAIMIHERVDVSISGNATNMVKFQHPVGGAYKKWTAEHGLDYFACASGGGIGRTMNCDDISAGPASYGFTDMMSRMYADTMFAGSSSVPAHVEMMGFVGMGNNPMVGASVLVAVEVSRYLRRKAAETRCN